MKLEVSIGECFDKYSILDLKSKRIKDQNKLIDVHNELESMSAIRDSIFRYSFLYGLLLNVNNSIWDLTDRLKQIQTPNEEYAQIAFQIINENQSRFRIKNMINHITNSSIKEQKSYSETEISIHVTSLNTAIPVIWNLSVLYDRVVVSGDSVFLKGIFRTPNFTFESRPEATRDIDFNVPIQTFPPLHYLSGGRLGDFIHQLSVVFEKYVETGRPGVIYLGEHNIGGDLFARGVQNTLEDIKPFLQTLPYVQSVEIYSGQSFDINLSKWRYTDSMYTKSWQDIYGSMYNVNWASYAWIHSSTSPELTNVTLISSTPARWSNTIVWTSFIKTLPGTVMFLRISDSDYKHFCEKSGLSIPCIDVKTFSDLVIAINSCIKFVGTLSMPLAVADALKKDRIALIDKDHPDSKIAMKTNSNYAF
jgi:hypothetical protein